MPPLLYPLAIYDALLILQVSRVQSQHYLETQSSITNQSLSDHLSGNFKLIFPVAF